MDKHVFKYFNCFLTLTLYDTLGICFPWKRTFVERDTTLRNSLCLADCQIDLAHIALNI